MHSYTLLFQAIPKGISFFLLIAFPISIALAELATYYGYLMPRLKSVLKKKWLAVLLPVIFLSIQHCCLPLIFDVKFLLYRGLMYFPFALLIGLAINKRPKLLPYFVILHGLMDLQAIIMLIIL
jgi:membrane protease YdiL (CAAX protease family)